MRSCRQPSRGLDSDARQVIQALARTGAFANPLKVRNGAIPVYRQDEKGGRKVGDFPQALWTKFVALGLVTATGAQGHWRLTQAGQAAAKRVAARNGKQRRYNNSAAAAKKEAPLTAQINDEESPLAWLARRKNRDGKPMLTEGQFAAGERLRQDFSRACLSPKVTMDWSTALSARHARGGDGCVAGPLMNDVAVAARAKVNTALAAVGPELAGILIDVCCHLKGLEAAEKASGWPQRSAKVILLLALSSLARHYGFDDHGNGGLRHPTGEIRHWGSDGFRPEISLPAPPDG